MNFSIGGLCRARTSKNRGSCIGRVVQHPQHIMVLDLSPHNFSLMRPAPHPPRKEQMLLVKVANGRASRSGVLVPRDGFGSACSLVGAKVRLVLK
jgi:hypothetical protein